MSLQYNSCVVSKLVLLLRGIAKGEPTARLARELLMSRKQMHTLRHRVQQNLYHTLLRERLDETTFETDELYQNAGEKSSPHRDPKDPPRCRANKVCEQGTYEKDRRPIFIMVARERGVHKKYVHLYMSAYETMSKAKVIIAAIVSKICFGLTATPIAYACANSPKFRPK
jgi:hypothetical protein